MSLTDMLCDGIYVMYGLLDHGYSRKLNLTDPTLYILLSLAAQPSAGYATMKDMEALSTGPRPPQHQYPLQHTQTTAGARIG